MANEFIHNLNVISEATIKSLPSKEVKGKVVRMREYNFVNPLKNRSSFKTFDNDIIESTEKISLALQGKKVLSYAVCRELAKLNTKQKLESMGFKSIGVYANALFDIAVTTGNQYARVGELFINDDYEIKSEFLPSSISVSHLIEFLSYITKHKWTMEKLEEMYLEGKLLDGMSTKKLRQALKDEVEDNIIDTEATETSETESTQQAPETESTQQTPETESTQQAPETESTQQAQPTKVDDKQVEVGKILSSIDNIMLSFEKIFGMVGEESPEFNNLANSFEFIKSVAKSYIA